MVDAQPTGRAGERSGFADRASELQILESDHADRAGCSWRGVQAWLSESPYSLAETIRRE
jgi:hypothetical protein